MNGDISIGYAEDKSRVMIWLKDLLMGMLVCGIIGSGKTNLITLIALQLILHGVSVWWLDQSKRDGLYLAQMFPSMQYFRPNYNFFYNPLQDTQGRTRHDIITGVIEQFCRDMHMLLGSETYLSQSVFQTIVRMRQAGNNNAPTFFDIFETIIRDTIRSHRASEYQAVNLGRIQSLLNHIGETLNYHQGFDILKLAQSSFILDLVGYPAEIQRFIVGNLMQSLISTRQALGLLTNDLKVCVIFDEANRLFPRNEELNPAESIPVLSQIAQTAREFGIGLLGSSQTPSFMANSGLKSQSYIKALVGSLGSNDDYYDFGNVMGMTQDQIEWLKLHSETGRAVVKLAGGEFTHPFLVRIPFLNLKGIDQG